MEVGDRIRVMNHFGDSVDYNIEKFRHCLGFFQNDDYRTAQKFTPLCELYEIGPESKEDYISNFGNYQTQWVQSWGDLPRLKG